MNLRTTLVITTALVAVIASAAAIVLYQRSERQKAADHAASQQGAMVRMHSPVMGPQAAPITIVEFFDPACEACRAFYPYVKQILAAYPREARLVIRYTPLSPRGPRRGRAHSRSGPSAGPLRARAGSAAAIPARVGQP